MSEIFCGGGCYPSYEAWTSAVVAMIRATPPETKIRFKDLPVIGDTLVTFEGTVEEALAAGWADGEFGFVCPDCVATGLSETSGASVKTENDALVGLAVLAKAPRRRGGDRAGAPLNQKLIGSVHQLILDTVADQQQTTP